MKEIFDVMVSYSNEDISFANQIVDALEDKGYTCWIAPRNVVTGEEWMGEIMRAIRESKIFLLILTQNSNNSRQVVRELTNADNNQKPIICFQLENIPISDSISFFISSIHRHEAFDMNINEAIAKLFIDLSKRIPKENLTPIKYSQETDNFGLKNGPNELFKAIQNLKANSFSTRVENFVGREKELTILKNLFSQITDQKKDNLIVLLESEFGNGKSALINQFAFESNLKCFKINCYEENSDTGKIPLLDAIVTILSDKLRNENFNSAILDKKLVKYPIWSNLLKSRFGVKNSKLDVSGFDDRVFDEFQDLLIELLIEESFVLVFEDIHNADQSTLQILKKFCYSKPKLSGIIIYSTRPTNSYRRTDDEVKYFLNFKEEIVAESGVYDLKLSSGILVKDYVSNRYPNNNFNDKILSEIEIKSDGNPLFICQTFINWETQNDLFQGEDGFWMFKKGINLQVPRKLSSALNRRISNIKEKDEGLIEVLNNAAVAGEVFCAQIINDILQLDLTDKEFVSDYLEKRLKDKYQLIKSSTNQDFDNDYFQFIHQFIKEYIYDSLDGKREKYHYKLAKYYVQKYGHEDIYAGIIAHHLFESNQDVDALKFAIKAAQYESENGSFQEAEKWCLRILDKKEIIKSRDTKNIQLISLKAFELLGLSFYALGKMDKALGAYKKAIRLSEKLEYSFEQKVEIVAYLAEVCDETAEYQQGLDLISKFLYTNNNTLDSLYSKVLNYSTLLLEYRLNICADFEKKCKALINTLSHEAKTIFLKRISARLLNLLGVYYSENDLKLSVEYYKKALNIVNEIRDFRSSMSIQTNMAESLTYLGNLDEALVNVEEVIKRSNELISDENNGWASLIKGLIYFKRGDLQTALELTDYAESRLLKSHCMIIVPYAYSRKAEILFELGKFEQSKLYLSKAKSVPNVQSWILEDVKKTESKFS